MVPVDGVCNMVENDACSAGGSESVGRGGRGVFRREVCNGTEVTCADGKSDESCAATNIPPFITENSCNNLLSTVVLKLRCD